MIFCCKQHKTIDSVLARGEKLDSLVEKSSDLSAASQVSDTAPILQLCPLGFSHKCMHIIFRRLLFLQLLVYQSLGVCGYGDIQ